MVYPGHGIGWKEFFKAFGKEWKTDRVSDNAAALTFFGVLALFPFVLFLVTLAGLIMKPDDVVSVVNQLAHVAPGDATKIIGDQIRSIQQSKHVGLVTVGFVGAIWSASGGMVALMTALNIVYDVEEGRPFWKIRGIALLATLGAGLAVLVAALAAVAAGPIAQAIGGPIATAIVWLRLPIAGLVMMLVWAVLYYLLPDVEQEFRFITPGTIAGVVLWVAASWGFSFYVSHFGSYNKTYGAIGGVIVMLMWMWISAIILLAGAEINAVIEQLSPEGKRAGAKSLKEKGASAPPAAQDVVAPKQRPVPVLARVHDQAHSSKGTALIGGILALLLGRHQRRA